MFDERRASRISDKKERVTNLITQQALISRVKKASKPVKAGDFIKQEDVEKEIKNW